MGSSYTATCYAVEQAKGIDARTRRSLIKVKPKAIKQSLVSPYKRGTWYGDVWLVTDRDDGMLLEGGRSDLMVLQVEEHPSSGYLWRFGDLTEAGLTVTADDRASRAGKEHIGGVVMRRVMAEPGAGEGARGRVQFRETRPWQPEAEPLSSLELDIDLSGPVRTGLLPAQRETLLSVA
ncbi:protease inhibitor I42 family protein [Candidatus Palauibacter sp.]|uniref:protease inhibitor I42 family protein n=1 Tax=Candidatus Palauibacter sp. TaxID=3101350 RepID=UPI003B5CAB42